MGDRPKTKADVTGEMIEALKKSAIDWTKLDEIPPATRGHAMTMGAHITALDKQQKVARFRHFEFYCDEPPLIGGADEYPQPLTYLAASVGFCLLTQVVRYALMLRKTITKLECDAEFDSHIDGSVLKGDVQASVTEFRIHIRLESPEPDEEIARVIRLAKRGCYAEALVQTAVPMVSTCEVNGRELQVPLED
jgi:uncharacterized OsmC-like protein